MRWMAGTRDHMEQRTRYDTMQVMPASNAGLAQSCHHLHPRPNHQRGNLMSEKMMFYLNPQKFDDTSFKRLKALRSERFTVDCWPYDMITYYRQAKIHHSIHTQEQFADERFSKYWMIAFPKQYYDWMAKYSLKEICEQWSRFFASWKECDTGDHELRYDQSPEILHERIRELFQQFDRFERSIDPECECTEHDKKMREEIGNWLPPWLGGSTSGTIPGLTCRHNFNVIGYYADKEDVERAGRLGDTLESRCDTDPMAMKMWMKMESARATWFDPGDRRQNFGSWDAIRPL